MARRFSSSEGSSNLRLSLGMPMRSCGTGRDDWEDRVPREPGKRPSSRHGAGSQNSKPGERRRQTYVKPSAGGGFGSSRPSSGMGASSQHRQTLGARPQQRQTMNTASRPSTGR